MMIKHREKWPHCVAVQLTKPNEIHKLYQSLFSFLHLHIWWCNVCVWVWVHLCVGLQMIMIEIQLLTSHLSKMLESTQAIHKLTETDKGSWPWMMDTPCKKLFQFTVLAFSKREIYFMIKKFFWREKNVTYNVDSMPKII